MKAFPSVERIHILTNSHGTKEFKEEIYQHSGGMELRDYFAAKALQGMILNANPFREHTRQEFAKVRYQMADEMMKARNE